MNPTNGIQPQLVSVKKIWDRMAYCAFTDLVHFKDSWYCVFRESDSHQNGKNGTIRIITSKDTFHWKSVASFEESDIDLRDPKLSETPDGRLMLLCGGTVYEKRPNQLDRYITRQPRVSFSSDGKLWQPLVRILKPHEWLWRVTWHQGKAYGASYRHSNHKYIRRKWYITLYESDDGISYREIKQWKITSYPNETTIRFLETGEMVALVRREKKWRAGAWIGISKPPFTRWRWRDSKHYLGGPNFLMLPNQSMVASGRLLLKSPYGCHEKTVLARMTLEELKVVMVLPSGGDTSYPGMVYREGRLWVSYYSSHEDRTSIYLAEIKINLA